MKNIDKVNDLELKNELLKIVDPEQKNNLGKYHKEEKIEDTIKKWRENMEQANKLEITEQRKNVKAIALTLGRKWEI